MALWTLAAVDLFYFIMCEGPREQEFIKIAFGWEPGHMWLHTTLESSWPHYMMLEMCRDGLLDTFFWALTISWSRLLASVQSGPSPTVSYASFTLQTTLLSSTWAPLKLFWPLVEPAPNEGPRQRSGKCLPCLTRLPFCFSSTQHRFHGPIAGRTQTGLLKGAFNGAFIN